MDDFKKPINLAISFENQQGIFLQDETELKRNIFKIEQTFGRGFSKRRNSKLVALSYFNALEYMQLIEAENKSKADDIFINF